MHAIGQKLGQKGPPFPTKEPPPTPASGVQDVSVAEQKPQATPEVGGEKIAPPAPREQPTGKWPQDVQPQGQV